MLDITLEHTILEKCKDIDTNTREDVIFLSRINQHRIAVTEEIIELEEKKFREKSRMDLEWYSTFISSRNSKNSLFIMPPIVNKKKFNGLDKYLECIVNLCINTKDNILLSNCRKLYGIVKNDIDIYNEKEICNSGIKNKFLKYTLPINGVNIEANQDSKELGMWLGRFLQNDMYIVIHDNYIATSDNIKNFQKYILKYIDKGAEIHIFTAVTQDISKKDIKAEFEKEIYKPWKLVVYVVGSIVEHHARIILTNKYTLNIDKGMTVFGKGGKTHQSLINILDNRDVERYNYTGTFEKII